MNRHEVLYAEAGRVWRHTVLLPGGARVSDALAQWRQCCSDWPEAARTPAGLAVFGRVVGPDQPLRAGDRLELLRPLPTDPKQARRERAAQAKR